MAKVICTHRHASGSINGVRFDPHALGRISEELSDQQAEGFLAIPGYVSEEGIDTAKVDVAKERHTDNGNFMPSSFADQHPQMPATLRDASPGWGTKGEQTGSGADPGNEKNTAAARPPFKKK